MPTIENVMSEWKIDSVINSAAIDKELLKTPSIHAKYVEYLVFFKGKLSVSESKYRKMKWQKEKYWRGEMTKEELDEWGWSQWQRLKPTGQDLSRMFESDRDLTDLEEKVNYYKTGVSAIEYIMKQIQSRDYTLKTLFDYMKYMNP